MITPIAVVAHPKRYSMACALMDGIAAEALALDDNGLGCARNHQRAWTWLKDGSSEWSVVLEDDALPVPHFRDQLNMALAKAPTPLVSLYLGRSRPMGAQPAIARVIARDVCWITSTHLLHGVGYAMRTELIPDMLDWVEDLEPIDEAVTSWAQQNHYEIAYTRPSLVNHRDGETVLNFHPSMHADSSYAGDSGDLRQAWLWGEREQWDDSQVAM